jgi:hypothetical protein
MPSAGHAPLVAPGQRIIRIHQGADARSPLEALRQPAEATPLARAQNLLCGGFHVVSVSSLS